MANETYYSLLEISETASMLEVKAAYRRLINEVHPDRLANAPQYWQRKAEEKSKEINEAFGVLSNPEKRRIYDARLNSYRGSRENSQAASPVANSASPSGSAGQHHSQGSGGSQSRSSASYESARNSPPPREQYSQANHDRATSSDGVPRSPSQQSFSGVGRPERAFFSLVLAVFGFGVSFKFWESASVGEGLFCFVLAGSLLFGTAWMYQRRISRFLLTIRLSTRRHQLLATVSAIAIFLFAGKVFYSLRQNPALPVHEVSEVDLSAGRSSHTLSDSGTSSSTSNS